MSDHSYYYYKVWFPDSINIHEKYPWLQIIMVTQMEAVGETLSVWQDSFLVGPKLGKTWISAALGSVPVAWVILTDFVWSQMDGQWIIFIILCSTTKLWFSFICSKDCGLHLILDSVSHEGPAYACGDRSGDIIKTIYAWKTYLMDQPAVGVHFKNI